MEIVPISCVLNLDNIQNKLMILFEEMLGYCPPAISPDMFFSGLLKYPETQEIFLAIDRTTSNICGICTVVQEQTVFRKHLLITDLFVAKNIRRHKIGTMLLSSAKRFAKTTGCDRIVVSISRKFRGPVEDYDEFFTFHQFRTLVPHHSFTIAVR
jgi:GNAT superfamily N-acetyltransferase